MSKELIAIVKEITEKSDRLIVWNTKYYPRYWELVKRECSCPFYQLEEKEYNSQVKRLWVYVNHPKNKLMYVCEAIPVKGWLPKNPNCNITGCWDTVREYNESKAKSYVSDNICRFAYELNLLHEFSKGNSLEELRNYKHKKLGKPWKPPQAFVYVSSYPKLIEDIITGKIL